MAGRPAARLTPRLPAAPDPSTTGTTTIPDARSTNRVDKSPQQLLHHAAGSTVKPGERNRLLAEIGATYVSVIDMVRAGNLARIHDAQPGLRANSYDSDLVSGRAVSDPTGNAAGEPDPVQRDLTKLDSDLASAFRHLDGVRVALGNYGPARRATEADRLALQRVNTKPEPCCGNCATVKEANGDLPYLVPPRFTKPSTVGGRLTKPMLLCDWCVAFVSAQGVLPNQEQLEAHRDGRKVKVRDTSTSRRRTA